MNVIDFKKLNRTTYIARRMYVIGNICGLAGIDLNYLFGLFGLFNKKNSGTWFWQKAKLTGALKDDYNRFNAAVDKIVKDLKQADERKTKQQIDSTLDVFNRLISGMEANCNVDRNSDFSYVKGFLEKNMKVLIDDSLKRIK
jgi:hypothetical protein